MAGAALSQFQQLSPHQLASVASAAAPEVAVLTTAARRLQAIIGGLSASQPPPPQHQQQHSWQPRPTLFAGPLSAAGTPSWVWQPASPVPAPVFVSWSNPYASDDDGQEEEADECEEEDGGFDTAPPAPLAVYAMRPAFLNPYEFADEVAEEAGEYEEEEEMEEDEDEESVSVGEDAGPTAAA